MEFLDFQAIAKAVSFKDVLDKLEIPYTEIRGELKGQGFIVTLKTNRYTNPTGNDFGNVINFVMRHFDMNARDAASWLKKNFLSKQEEQPELPNYKLKYCDWLKDFGIPEHIAYELEIGQVVDHKGPAQGNIAIAIRDITGKKVGYAFYNPKKDKFFYFKAYKHDHIYNLDKCVPGCKIAFLFENPLNTAKHSNIPNCIGLTSGNLTIAQINALTTLEALILIHQDDARIQYLTNKLSPYLFVKALKDIKELDADKVFWLANTGRN